MQYKFRLNRLHCAGCAQALQENINSMDGVCAEINFVTKIIKLEITTEDPEKTLEDVKSAIVKFDHAVEILNYEDEEDIIKKEKRERNIKLFRYAFSVIFAVISLLVNVNWLKIVIFALCYIVSSYDVVYDSIINVIHGKILDEKFLMTIASIGAFVIGEYFEAIGVMVLYGIGEVLQDLSISKSKRTIKSVLELKQPYANLVNDNEEIQTDLASIKVGDLIRIKPGERVPLDCTIVEGTTYLNLSALTGETKEKVASIGDEILSGSINGESVILAKVTKLEKDSTVSKIIELVQNATETKAKSERFITKFSKIYTPSVIVLAFLMMFVPPIIFGFSTFSTYAYRALCFLVVSCPCALVISIPLSYFISIGALAKSGIIVKGATYLEELSQVDTVVFDKTGTLTEGKFEISEIYTAGLQNKEELIEIIAYAESFSNHRIAKSIQNLYSEMFHNKKINNAWISDYSELAGQGIMANIFMQEVLVGNAKFLKDNGINFTEVNKPGTILYVSVAGNFSGFVVISDTIKKDSFKAINKLKELKIENLVLSTGDDENVAKAITGKLGLTKYYSDLLPDEKLDIIVSEIQKGHHVAFVGDGINDAPSLANSNVGISMGGVGSDVAVESSDIVIMTDEPSKVANVIKKSKQTKTTVKQNIFGSIALKVAILFLISFGLTGMWLAIFADVGVSLLAILNSLKLMINHKEK